MLPCLAGCFASIFSLPPNLFLSDPVLGRIRIGSSLAVFFRKTPIDMHRGADLADRTSLSDSFFIVRD